MLKNDYFAMRHGQSKANLRHIIISHPDNGVHGDYGLTELGRRQVVAAAESAPLSSRTLIYASDFSRARETAELVREVLGASEIHLAEALRERNFGSWEKAADANYSQIWKADEISDHAGNDVESVYAVQERVAAFIAELEERYESEDILLVSHGDTLQILQAAFRKIDPAMHRSLPHLATAEIRHLELRAPRS
ncbi:MAG: histidine phosphatase family protein [Streptosporangiaceae bacterium]